MSLIAGIQVSLDNITWYKLSEHNRQPISTSYETIEKSERMANGTMRKYVIANKRKISTDWKDLPSLDINLVDYSSAVNTHGSAWMKSFYEGNVFNPIYIKLIYAKDTVATYGSAPDPTTYTDIFSSTGEVLRVFMTSFTHDVTKRRIGGSANVTGGASQVGTGYDYANVKIEFTEI